MTAINRTGEINDGADLGENYLNFLHGGPNNILSNNDCACIDDVVLSEEFKQNYETWLDQEVFQTQVDWDVLLSPVE